MSWRPRTVPVNDIANQVLDPILFEVQSFGYLLIFKHNAIFYVVNGFGNGLSARVLFGFIFMAKVDMVDLIFIIMIKDDLLAVRFIGKQLVMQLFKVFDHIGRRIVAVHVRQTAQFLKPQLVASWRRAIDKVDLDFLRLGRVGYGLINDRRLISKITFSRADHRSWHDCLVIDIARDLLRRHFFKALRVNLVPGNLLVDEILRPILCKLKRLRLGSKDVLAHLAAIAIDIGDNPLVGDLARRKFGGAVLEVNLKALVGSIISIKDHVLTISVITDLNVANLFVAGDCRTGIVAAVCVGVAFQSHGCHLPIIWVFSIVINKGDRRRLRFRRVENRMLQRVIQLPVVVGNR